MTRLTYVPRHRRTEPWWDDQTVTDNVHNMARCVNTGKPTCNTVCPRHSPADYADMMARHATDSVESVTLPIRCYP